MIDRNLDWRLSAGEPIALRYRRELADGTRRELAGETLRLTIYLESEGPSRAFVDAIIAQDLGGDVAEARLPAGTSALLAGEIGLAWELAEMLGGGERQRLLGGRFVVEPGPVATGGATGGEPDWDEITEQDDSE